MCEMINGYEICFPWKMTPYGMITFVMRNGKRFSIKKYTEIKKPVSGPDISEKVYESRLKRFNDFFTAKKEINESLRMVSDPDGNIDAPVEEFLHENCCCEVFKYYDRVTADPEKIMAIPYRDRVLILRAGAAALEILHEQCKIIHGDISLGNLIAVRDREGKLSGKLTGFGNSFFENRPIPEGPGGNVQYMSPELMLYLLSEGDPDLGRKISSKTDIYSLGLVFHKFLAGSLPEYTDIPEGRITERITKGKSVHPCQVSAAGGRLVISQTIEDAELRDLLEEMLFRDPENRPAAREVLEKLKRIPM